MDVGNRPVVGVVEDSDEDFALMARVFAPDWDLRRWETGEAALEDFTREAEELGRLTVLVVDLGLAGITGEQVVQRVRQLPEGKTLPVCLLTGSRREQDRRLGLEVGADAYLVKPDNAARLRELPGLLAQLASRR